MANLLDYVEKYGDLSFTKKPFTEVDNVIFSLLSYLDYTHTHINENNHTLTEIGREYMLKNDYKSIQRLGVAMGGAYRVLAAVVECERYRNIIVKDYIYNTRRDMQFSAKAGGCRRKRNERSLRRRSWC